MARFEDCDICGKRRKLIPKDTEGGIIRVCNECFDSSNDWKGNLLDSQEDIVDYLWVVLGNNNSELPSDKRQIFTFVSVSHCVSKALDYNDCYCKDLADDCLCGICKYKVYLKNLFGGFKE